MREIVERLLELHRVEEITTRGNTTLREVLENLSNRLHIQGYIREGDYVLHHRDGDHDNNDISNLVLMDRRRHISYHSRIRHKGIDKKSQEALDYFNREYSKDCVFIGDVLESILQEFTEAEIKSEESAE